MKRCIIFSIVVLLFVVIVSAIVYSYSYKTYTSIDTKYSSGLDVLQSQDFSCLKEKNVGILTHSGAKNKDGVSTLDIFLTHPDIHCCAIFTAEHESGFRSLNKKIKNNIPVYNTHTCTHQGPDASWLHGLDVVVIDLQGVGMRYYTYEALMLHTMLVCFQYGVEVVVLDRPNPLGNYCGGPALDEDNMSFLGMHVGMPLFHGMTIGEIANYIKNRGAGYDMVPLHGVLSDCGQSLSATKKDIEQGKLQVIKMHGYNPKKSMLVSSKDAVKDQMVDLSPRIQIVEDIFDYAITSLGFITCSLNHGISPNIFYFYSYSDVGKHAFKYFRSDRMSCDDILLCFSAQAKKYADVLSGLDVSKCTIDGVEYIQCSISDFQKTSPAAFSLCMLALGKQLSSVDEWQQLQPWQQAMLRAHVGDNELYNCLINEKEIDISYFLNKWLEQAKQFQKKVHPYRLYK